VFSVVQSACLTGLEAITVDVEVSLQSGPPRFVLIGLGGSAVRESRDRVIAAIRTVGADPPDQILVNLAPAEVKKEGSAFDVAMALGILGALGRIPLERFRGTLFLGELSLDGSVKPVQGAVAATLAAARNGIERCVVPIGNFAEASLVPGVRVVGIRTLSDAITFVCDGIEPEYTLTSCSGEQRIAPAPLLLGDVRGQEAAKRALIVAAAGGHNLLMVGPPGCGKSMLAARLTGLLPPLSRDERLDLVQIYSSAGLSFDSVLRGDRPFRAPHHVTSDVGLIGGGPQPRPGEVSLAHNGILFLDEFPEYRRTTLEALRLPLETGAVQISRARGTVTLPARFQLIAAMNPCPCGRLGSGKTPCRCSRNAVAAYLARLSQPVLDRIDLHVELESVELGELGLASDHDQGPGDVSEIVERAREIQIARQGGSNTRLSLAALTDPSWTSPEARALSLRGARHLGLSARGYVKLLRVARTIADLAGVSVIGETHVSEALQYRCLDRLAKYVGMNSRERGGSRETENRRASDGRTAERD
jgi:magnesium chelatase family protein